MKATQKGFYYLLLVLGQKGSNAKLRKHSNKSVADNKESISFDDSAL